jgi:hypothetical protein
VDAAMVVKVTGRLFPLSTWLRDYGKPHYGLTSEPYVRALCGQEPAIAAKNLGLPPGWAARKVFGSWFLLHDEELPRDERRSHSKGGRPRTVPDDVIEKIRQLGSRGLDAQIGAISEEMGVSPEDVRRIEVGEIPAGISQAMAEEVARRLSRRPRGLVVSLASQLGVSESMVSLVLRNKRRSCSETLSGQRVHAAALAVEGVKGSEVDRVIRALIKPAVWLKRYGRDNGFESLRQLEDTLNQSGQSQGLPQPWGSVRLHTVYYIYRTS